MELYADFRVDLLFPDDYEDFIAEVYYKDVFVCLISQQGGLVVEFEKSLKVVPLDGFLATINYATRRLYELRKPAEHSTE